MINEEERQKAQESFLGEAEGGLSIDDFLNHTSRSGSGSFLSGDWKTKPGWIKVWLHLEHLIYAAWFHSFYKVIEVKDKEGGGKKSMVVSTRWNCRDFHPELGPKLADKLLRKARWRQDDGSREHPPQLCPFCLFEDWLAIEIRAGRIGITEPVFRFTDAKGDKSMVLHAGGIVGFFGDKASDAEKAQMKAAKIVLKDAWKEKTTARLNYLLVLVPEEETEDGPKKYFAPEALGDKLKATIRKEMSRRPKAPEKGHPIKNPYPFIFKYDDDQLFEKKYDVDPLEEAPSPDVLAEISGEKLDLSNELGPGNCRELRMLFETYAVIDAPWDRFFAPAEKAGLMEGDDRREKNVDTDTSDDDKPELFACDACDASTLTMDRNTSCTKCGAHYGADGVLDQLLCLGCGAPVAMTTADGVYVCAACGVRHALRMEQVTEDFSRPVWTKAAPEPEQAKPKEKKRRGRKAAEKGA